MRVMVLVKSDERTEAGDLGEEREYAEMGMFNEVLVNAGVMLAGEGLHPSSKGARIRFGGASPTVTEGPFPGPRGLVAGFWLWKVDSLEEAIDWARRAPFTEGAELEIRQVMEEEDFGDALTPEVREQEKRLRERTDALRKASESPTRPPAGTRVPAGGRVPAQARRRASG